MLPPDEAPDVGVLDVGVLDVGALDVGVLAALTGIGLAAGDTNSGTDNRTQVGPGRRTTGTVGTRGVSARVGPRKIVAGTSRWSTAGSARRDAGMPSRTVSARSQNCTDAAAPATTSTAYVALASGAFIRPQYRGCHGRRSSDRR